MKLATLRCQHPDGTLIVVSQDNRLGVKVPSIAPSFREAVENWHHTKPLLEKISEDLNQGRLKEAFSIDENFLHSPLPRSFAWLDGSAFIQHILLVRKARNVEPPPTLRTFPLMYQGGSDSFLGPRENIPFIHPTHGLDFEGEIAIITDFVPMGTKAHEAHKFILFFLLVNDITLRGLVPAELGHGFGFLQSKPSSAFSPFALTPDELGTAWRDGRVHLPLLCEYNNQFFGNPNAGEMHFSFYQLIEHAARTRSLTAGTILGSGTVSNEDTKRGSSCLAEKRMLEQINQGEIKTPFMQIGDSIKIEMRNEKGNNLFGSLFQKVVAASIKEDHSM